MPETGLALMAGECILAPMAESSSVLEGSDSGRYRISGTLGEGGMGEVFKGVHIELGRDVAIKRLKHEAALDESIVRRFFNEARAVNAIRHENIVEVTDLFTDDQGRVHMVMEYLEGCTLGDLIKAKAPLPPHRVAHIGAQIADALAAAHDKGIIHRDVKPANVFLIQRRSTDDYVKLLDLGIAHLHPDSGGIAATESGQIVGTPIYMPPEQAKGDPISAAADIYSLGIILYEMLSGDFPFPKSSAIQMMMAHISDPPRPLRVEGLPDGFRHLVESCLEKEEKDRPRDAKTIASDLEEWAKRTKRSTATHRKERHQTKETPPPPSSAFAPTLDSPSNDDKSPPPKTQTRFPRSWILAGVVVLIGGIAGALLLSNGSSKSESSEREAELANAPAVVIDGGKGERRAQLTEHFAALGIPTPPSSCQSSDSEILETHLKVAALLKGGKPGSQRDQDKQAIRALHSIGDDMSPETLFWLARANLFAGDTETAIKKAASSYQYCKDFAAAYAAEGTAYAVDGKHQQAMQSLEHAVELESGYTDARFNLAYSQILSGDAAGAVASLSVVIAQDPKLTDARYLRGESYIALKKLEQARKDLERAVLEWGDKGSPASAGAWYALSYARRETGDAAGARKAACKAHSLKHPRAICPRADAPLPAQADEWVSDLFDAQR